MIYTLSKFTEKIAELEDKIEAAFGKYMDGSAFGTVAFLCLLGFGCWMISYFNKKQ